MIERFFPLALLLLWSPAALAFPPCPTGPVELLPLDGAGRGSSTTEPWFQVGYAMVGNHDIIDGLRAVPDERSKCRDQLSVPQANASGGAIQLSPAYAPSAGFGVLALPELAVLANDRLHLQYRLDFKIDNAPLARTGDWIDVTQLEFAHDRKQAGKLSAVYRVRKIQRYKDLTTLQVIESRADDAPPGTKPALVDRVIAEVSLMGDSDKTAIALRWTQLAQTATDAEPVAPILMYSVDSVLEVLGPGKEAVGPADYVLYATSLPRQWADALSMGLLDYNVPSGKEYDSQFRLVIDDPQLSAEVLNDL